MTREEAIKKIVFAIQNHKPEVVKLLNDNGVHASTDNSEVYLSKNIYSLLSTGSEKAHNDIALLIQAIK